MQDTTDGSLLWRTELGYSKKSLMFARYTPLAFLAVFLIMERPQLLPSLSASIAWLLLATWVTGAAAMFGVALHERR
jgi:hypothetical protein